MVDWHSGTPEEALLWDDAHVSSELPVLTERARTTADAYEREALIQRIADRLRLCDLATLEGVAELFEQRPPD